MRLGSGRDCLDTVASVEKKVSIQSTGAIKTMTFWTLNGNPRKTIAF